MTEWTEIIVIIPEGEAREVLQKLREITDCKQIDEDWTVEKRERDNATVEYHPCPTPLDRKSFW